MQTDYQKLGEIVCADIDVLLDDLGVELKRNGNRLSGPCLIHAGDNSHAFNIYLDRDRFFCFSQMCHKAVFNSIIGFTRLVLSSRFCGWSKQGDSLYSFHGYHPVFKGIVLR